MDSKQKIKKLVQKLKAERKKMDEPKAPKESKKKEQADKPEKEQAAVYVGPKGGKYIQTKTGKRKYKGPDSKPAQKDDAKKSMILTEEKRVEKQISDYDVAMSLDAMMRAAHAKQDKEMMKRCMEEVQKRKKQISSLMKDLNMKKSEEVKKQVAGRLAKAFSEKEITDSERQKLIAVDVLLKALQTVAPEAEQVKEAAGTEVVEPKKEVKFADGLFQDYSIGSVLSHSKEGTIVANAKRPPQDYVANGSKINNKAYTEEELKAEIAAQKK
jgi:hypothetical protein